MGIIKLPTPYNSAVKLGQLDIINLQSFLYLIYHGHDWRKIHSSNTFTNQAVSRTSLPYFAYITSRHVPQFFQNSLGKGLENLPIVDSIEFGVEGEN